MICCITVNCHLSKVKKKKCSVKFQEAEEETENEITDSVGFAVDSDTAQNLGPKYIRPALLWTC